MAPPPVPIAVIGIGCRLSGGVTDTESLWSLLAGGQNTWTDVPAARFRWKSFDHPSRTSLAAYSHRGGHFIQGDIAAFDAKFFGISPLEAEAVDPQQRIALEVAYEALENAGIPVEQVAGSDTGVYMATFTHDYENLMYKDCTSMPNYGMTGVGNAIVSNRISYSFDFHGPSVTIDTGCSGSLVALHHACQSLQLEETGMTLVGGTSLILSPDTMIPMHKLNFLNNEGRCFSFDEKGAGYGRGEGVVIIALKRLEDALAHGDPIRGVIRATAVGQDGKTKGITAPSLSAQKSLIATAYRRAQLNIQDTIFVEAHGTGTVKGDLTEVQALHAAFASPLRVTNLCVGSVKANIGHTESASGLAGLVKALLALEKGVIPPTPSIKNLRSKLLPYTNQITFATAPISWPKGAVRRASVNSFAYGGTNAHAIVDAAPTDCQVKNEQSCPRSASEQRKGEDNILFPNLNFQKRKSPRLHMVTAKAEGGLRVSINKLRFWIQCQDHSAISIDDLAYTLTHRRSLMQWRYAFIGADKAECLDQLQSKRKLSQTMERHRVTFLFTGQGAQWFGMGRELFYVWKFRESLERSQKALSALGCSWNLFDELSRDEGDSNITSGHIGQPATTAIQIALVDTLQWLDIHPSAVLGHSSGEIAAAYTVGALTQESALKVAYLRGLLAAKVKDLMGVSGAMMAVGMGSENIQPHLSMVTEGKVVIACSNSPASVTVSGDRAGVEQLQGILQGAESPVHTVILKVDTAYHSHHMQLVAEDYRCLLSDLRNAPKDPDIRLFSSVTGNEYEGPFDGSYWVSNLVSRVEFNSSLTHLCHQMSNGANNEPTSPVMYDFLEVGPHKALSSYLVQNIDELALPGFTYVYDSLLIRRKDAYRSFLEAVGGLLERGYLINTNNLNNMDHGTVIQRQHRTLTNLPTYSWDHARSFWHESRVSRQHRLRNSPCHDLCGIRSLDDTLLEPRWRHIISLETLPWLRDHQVDGVIVFPGAGYIAMAIEAMTQIVHARFQRRRIGKYLLRNVHFEKLLEVNDSATGVELHMSLRTVPNSQARDDSSSQEEFRISSVKLDGTATHHCNGIICVGFVSDKANWNTEEGLVSGQEEAQIKNEHRRLVGNEEHRPWDPKALYNGLERYGHYWGPTFGMIKSFRIGHLAGTGTVTVPNIAESMPSQFLRPHTIHPTTLDALIHSTLIIFGRECCRSVMFPVEIGELSIRADVLKSPGDSLAFSAVIDPKGQLDETAINVAAWNAGTDGLGRLSVILKDGKLRGTENLTLSQPDPRASTSLFHRIEWKNDIDISPPAKCADWIAPEQTSDLTSADLTCILNNAALNLVQFGLTEISEEEVAHQHTQYYSWMKSLAQSSGYKSRNHNGSNLNGSSALKEVSVEGEALETIKAHLVSILRGKAQAVSLFLEDDLLRRLYASDWSAARCIPSLITYFRHLAFKKPGLNVLEIGAGTGGATLPLLRSLCPGKQSAVSSYYFTDISSGFFDQAQDLLSEWGSILTYKTLDVSKDALNQGFEEHSFDVCFAYNALHAAPSLECAIQNVRKLLKPDGRLILLEMTTLHPFVNAIYGLFPGWHLNRTDGRIESPLQSIQQWDARLQSGGFRPLELIARDFDGLPSRTSAMVAQMSQLDPANLHCILHGGEQFNQKHRESLLRRATESSLRLVSAVDPSPLLTTDNQGEAVILVYQDAGSVQLAKQNGTTETPTCLGALRIISAHPVCSTAIDSLKIFGKHVDVKSGVHLVTLQLVEDTQAEQDAIALTILRVLTRTFSDRKPQSDRLRETSYLYQNGSLMIPRLIHADDGGFPNRSTSQSERQQDIDGQGKVTGDRQASGKVSKKLDESLTHLLDRGIYLIVGELDDIALGICHYLSTKSASQIAILPLCPISPQTRSSFDGDVFVRGIQSHIEVLQAKLGIDPDFNIQTVLKHYHSIEGCFLVGEVDDQIIHSISRDLSLEFIVHIKDPSRLSSDPILLPSAYTMPTSLSLPRAYTLYVTLPQARTRKVESGLNTIAQHDLGVIISSVLEAPHGGEWATPIVSAFSLEHSMHSHRPSEVKNPFLSHLVARSGTNGATTSREQEGHTSSGLQLEPGKVHIKDASSPEEARQIVTKLVKHTISTLVVTKEDLPETGKSIEDFGLDSFTVFRMRNWIFGTFKADLEPVEISGSPSIHSLVSTVLQRTPFRSWMLGVEKDTAVGEGEAKTGAAQSLQKQPLPELKDTLTAYLDAVHPFCTATEIDTTKAEIAKFQVTGSLGLELQRRLRVLADDPSVDNWLSDLYMKRRFLALRSSLVAFQTYFGTHPHGPAPRSSQAERATLLTVTAFNFKRKLEAGLLETQYLSGHAIDPDSYRWQFNTCREPHIGQDRIQKYTGGEHEYVVVFRRGHAFKVPLTADDGNVVTAMTLQSEFQGILDLPLAKSELSILTADMRESWAMNRSRLLALGGETCSSIQIIEAAAFAICLDDNSPKTPHDRFRQFLLADTANRWFDKTLQFAVCPDGTSASIMEHATLDGISVEPLHAAINAAIDNQHQRDIAEASKSNEKSVMVARHHQFQPLPLIASSEISAVLQSISQTLLKTSEDFSFASLSISRLTPPFCVEYKTPFQGSLQLALQLAARRFFGHTLPATETVSLSHFQRGRVDVNAIITAPMMLFLNAAALDSQPSRQLRDLADNATREHVRNLGRVSRGFGYGRHLLALEWMIADTETRPSFFDDPSYAKSKPGRVLTSSFTTGWLEGGFVYPPPDSVLIYFQVGEEKLSFSIFGHGVDAQKYATELDRATEEVRMILEFRDA